MARFSESQFESVTFLQTSLLLKDQEYSLDISNHMVVMANAQQVCPGPGKMAQW